MEFNSVVNDRRSIRRYLQEPINKEDIIDIITLATQACNAGNEQGWHFSVIYSPAVKTDMAKIVRDKIFQLATHAGIEEAKVKPIIGAADFFEHAPVTIAVWTKKVRSKADNILQQLGYEEIAIDDLRCRPDLQTIGAVVQLLILAAWEKEIGACWMTGPMIARTELEKYLQKPEENYLLAAIVPLGKPAITSAKRTRKAVEQVISFF